MKIHRYIVSAEITAACPPDRAYALACAPELIPSYENGISEIEVIEEITASERLVRTTLRILGFRAAFLYRHRYSKGRHYSGVQERGSIVRGFFSFSFDAVPGGTRIIHREGVFSRIPFAATLIGWLYFHVLARGGLEAELAKLKTLIEASA